MIAADHAARTLTSADSGGKVMRVFAWCRPAFRAKF